MEELYLSEEQKDFLGEMMNIGAGNASAALEQVLKCDADLKLPMVHVLEPQKVSTFLGNPSMAAVCVRMRMVGDIKGEMFFIIPDEHREALVHMAKRAMPGSGEKGLDVSVMAEIGNILGGVYLTAVHDFCKLNIYHTVPVVRDDMLQALLDESVITLSRGVGKIILVENEFMADGERIRVYMIMIPSPESVVTLVSSIEAAKAAYENG